MKTLTITNKIIALKIAKKLGIIYDTENSCDNNNISSCRVYSFADFHNRKLSQLSLLSGMERQPSETSLETIRRTAKRNSI